LEQNNFLFDKLKNNFREYTKNQKVLARFILKNYQKVAFTTITQFSKISGISEATINRFVKILGFRGYITFQKEIRRILRADLKGNERYQISYSSEKEKNNTISRIINKEIENLSYLQKTYDEKKVKEAVFSINNANNIVVVGARSTASLAYDFWFCLTKLGLKAKRVTSITTEIYDYINNLDKQSLVIVINFPRYLVELVDIIKFSKERGIKTIAITDSSCSPINSDINLYTPAESISFIPFHCAPLVLIKAIINELSLLDKEKTLNTLNNFEKLAEDRGYFDKSFLIKPPNNF